MFHLKMSVDIIRCKSRNDVMNGIILGQNNILSYKRQCVHFVLALIVSDIVTFKDFDLQKVGQGHGV